MAEGCFGVDAAVWRELIAKLKVESDAIDKTIQTYLEMQAGKVKEPH